MSFAPQSPQIRWFQAKDVCKTDKTPFSKRVNASQQKPPDLWEPFSQQDSKSIEDAYLALKEGSDVPPKVPVGEDFLFEANVASYEVGPVYWLGKIFEIRRGLWFEAKSYSGPFAPVEDLLNQQIEDGYRKFTPWTSKQVLNDQKPLDAPAEARWALFGKYMNQSVVYTGEYEAWLQSDHLIGKLSRMYSSGTLLVRGWNNVQQLKKSGGKRKLSKAGEKPVTVMEGDTQRASMSNAAQEEQEKLPEDLDDDQTRQIDHLILVIHGIGQRLGESIDLGVNFTKDVNVLRSTLKSASKYLKQTLPPNQGALIPNKGGIQVLPIQWRSRLNVAFSKVGKVDMESSDDILLSDIALEGIPAIRTLVSDVILDGILNDAVLLYMTPKYRQEMILQVSVECNRIYNLYKERNPGFAGKVSIYGHSLGSVLAYEILSNDQPQPEKRLIPPHVKRDSSGVDLTDVLMSGPSSKFVNGLIEPSTPLVYEPLVFDTDHFYGNSNNSAVGSPIGIFLLLSGCLIRPSEADSKNSENAEHAQSEAHTSTTPRVKSMYNIFHPYDPVAHRVEPLVDKRFSQTKACPIPYTKGGLTQTLNMGTEIVTKGFSMLETMRASIVKSTASNMTNFFSKTAVVQSETTEIKDTQDELDPKAKGDQLKKLLEKLNPTGRIDYCIQEGVLENPYLSSLGVHMAYWGDSDCAALMMRSLYGIEHAQSQRDSPGT